MSVYNFTRCLTHEELRTENLFVTRFMYIFLSAYGLLAFTNIGCNLLISIVSLNNLDREHRLDTPFFYIFT